MFKYISQTDTKDRNAEKAESKTVFFLFLIQDLNPFIYSIDKSFIANNKL